VLEKSDRPWGRYEVLQESPSHKVKRHQKRSEHWFIVSGNAQVTINGVISSLGAGDSLDIPAGSLHRIANIGDSDVVFIEVQTGTYFGEDDIERIEDDFGR
jgi:mannose-6-phosphate isomerase